MEDRQNIIRRDGCEPVDKRIILLYQQLLLIKFNKILKRFKWEVTTRKKLN